MPVPRYSGYIPERVGDGGLVSTKIIRYIGNPLSSLLEFLDLSSGMSAFKCPYKPTKTCDTYLQLSLVDEEIQIFGGMSVGGIMQLVYIRQLIPRARIHLLTN